MATEISQEAAIDVAWRTPGEPFNFFSCRPRPTYLPRGDRVAIRPRMQRVCGPSAEVSARTRASSRIAGRHHFRRSRPRHRNIIPRSPPMRRASPPPARSSAANTRKEAAWRRAPTQRENLRSENTPMRRASPLLCAHARYPIARGSCLALPADPRAEQEILVVRHDAPVIPRARASAAHSREESSWRRAPTPARTSLFRSRNGAEKSVAGGVLGGDPASKTRTFFAAAAPILGCAFYGGGSRNGGARRDRELQSVVGLRGMGRIQLQPRLVQLVGAITPSHISNRRRCFAARRTCRRDLTRGRVCTSGGNLHGVDRPLPPPAQRGAIAVRVRPPRAAPALR